MGIWYIYCIAISYLYWLAIWYLLGVFWEILPVLECCAKKIWQPCIPHPSKRLGVLNGKSQGFLIADEIHGFCRVSTNALTKIIHCVCNRVAKWYILKTKIPILVNFSRP
jgi:hypothetical protein